MDQQLRHIDLARGRPAEKAYSVALRFYPELCAEKALIFRIVHRDNLPWLLANGLQCRNSDLLDPNYVGIGNPDLIDKRRTRAVDVDPYGTLSDYIPFYFTPFSMMMFNIKTGYNGITKRSSADIVILVSSLPFLQDKGIRFLFTQRHAYPVGARFFSNLSDLSGIDWNILQHRDFSRDNDDIDKTTRYQAEALVYGSMPVDALLGIVCYNDVKADAVKALTARCGVSLRVIAKSGWYF